MISEKVQVATTMRPKVAMLTSGMDRSVVAMKRDNARGARGAGHPLYDPFIVANRQRDEPLGCSGGRQPSSVARSRMTGDRLVRICEGSRVKFLRSTRQGGSFTEDRVHSRVTDCDRVVRIASYGRIHAAWMTICHIVAMRAIYLLHSRCLLARCKRQSQCQVSCARLRFNGGTTIAIIITAVSISLCIY